MGDSGGNLLEAISIGTLEGLKLALNVGAMLIAFLALIAMADGLLGWVGAVRCRRRQWSLSRRSLSALRSFAPIAWIMGIPWEDCLPVGPTARRENGRQRVRRLRASGRVDQAGLGRAARATATRHDSDLRLCGFANFSSIGIQIGGIGGMAPEPAARPRQARPAGDARRGAWPTS